MGFDKPNPGNQYSLNTWAWLSIESDKLLSGRFKRGGNWSRWHKESPDINCYAESKQASFGSTATFL